MNKMFEESIRGGARNGNSTRRKAALLCVSMGVFLACAIAAYALVQLWGSQSMTINNTKGHVFEFELTGVPAAEVTPGSEQTLSPTVINKSTTDNVYCFIGFDYDEILYEITDVEGWELVEDQGGHVIYSYSTDGTMNEVEMGNTAAFSGKLKCIAESEVFQLLDQSDFAVNVTGYVISTSICDSTNDAAWQNYQTGGSGN